MAKLHDKGELTVDGTKIVFKEGKKKSGYMGYTDMLGKFFKNNQNSVDSGNRNIGEKFYLKPHAERDFFAWVNQWAIMVKMPSDLGFSDEKYKLPELILKRHTVANRQSNQLKKPTKSDKLK